MNSDMIFLGQLKEHLILRKTFWSNYQEIHC